MKLRKCVYDSFFMQWIYLWCDIYHMFMIYKISLPKNLMYDTVFMNYVFMNFFKRIQDVSYCESHLLTSSVKVSAGCIEFFYKHLFSSHTFWKTFFRCKGLVEKVAKSSNCSVQL